MDPEPIRFTGGPAMSRSRIAVILLAVATVLAGVRQATAPGLAAGKHCKVSLTAGLNNTTPNDLRTKYTFGVGANSAEACADVAYTLVVTEQLPDGKTRSTDLHGDMRVRGQTRIEVISYDTDSKNTLKSFEARMNSCQVCDAP
jgi:hypothetical protein